MTMVVADVDGSIMATATPVIAVRKDDRATFARVDGGPDGISLKAENGRITLTVPATDKPAAFRLALGSGSESDLKAFAEVPADGKAPLDLTAHLKGGPAHWSRTVETKGQLGTGDGAYVVDTITAPDVNPYHSWIRFGGQDFFSGGTKAALTTWSGDVWTVSGVDDSLEKLTWRRIATGLFQPLGLKIVDDEVYVLGRDGITRLVDLNGDGEADFYEAFNHDMAVTTGFHEFAFDLQTDREGNFYFAKAAPGARGRVGASSTSPRNSGTVMKVSKDGKTLVNYATGLRAPNGIGIGPEGQVTSGDNEGTWMPKCRLNLLRPGGFYGVVDTAHRADKPIMYDEPICWFPKGRGQLRRRPGVGDVGPLGAVPGAAAPHLLRYLLAVPGPGRPVRRPHPGGRGPVPGELPDRDHEAEVQPPRRSALCGGAPGLADLRRDRTPRSRGSATPASRPTWSRDSRSRRPGSTSPSPTPWRPRTPPTLTPTRSSNGTTSGAASTARTTTRPVPPTSRPRSSS